MAASSAKLPPIPTVLASLSAALAGPVAQAQSDWDYAYVDYREAPVAANRTASGQAEERFRIRSHRLRNQWQRGDDQFSADASVEFLSGASPWYVLPAADDQRPVQVMSGASIREQRQALSLGWQRQAGAGRLWGAQLGVSDEDDYRSYSVGGSAAWDSTHRRWTWSLGGQYNSDELFPTDGASAQFPQRIRRASRDGAAANSSLSYVLSPRSMLQLGVQWEHQRGFLSDPYKLVWVQNETRTIADARPERREILALSLRGRYHLGTRTALHLNLGASQDDWGIHAHSAELRLRQSPPQGLGWNMLLRWYSQSQADFYTPFLLRRRVDGIASSDPRLSPFGALMLGLSWRQQYSRWWWGGGMDVYQADGRYALEGVEQEAPALLGYWNGFLRIGRDW
nr:DUF3570 domain-containing protein [Oceanococcus sp. HetDA_MAG_MS8]